MELETRRSLRLQKKQNNLSVQIPIELKTNITSTQKLRSQGPAQEFKELPNKAPSRKRKQKTQGLEVDESTRAEENDQIHQELSTNAQELQFLKEANDKKQNKITQFEIATKALEKEKRNITTKCR